MEWLELGLAFILAAFWLSAPGLAILMGLRGARWSNVALSPLLGIGILSLSTILFSILGVSWNSISYSIETIVLLAVGLIAFLARRKTLPRNTANSSLVTYSIVGATIGAILVIVQLVVALRGPYGLSQTYDNVFHANAIRYVVESQLASPLDIGAWNNLPYYPAAWHALVALPASLGIPLTAAINGTNIAITAVVWIPGCIFLAHCVRPKSLWVPLIIGVLATALPAFPLNLLDFGVLYPNFFGYALLPAALALAVLLLGFNSDGPPEFFSRSWWTAFLVLGIGALGIALVHPNAFMSLLAFLCALILPFYWRMIKVFRSEGGKQKLVFLSLAIVLFYICVLIFWNFVRPPAEAAGWATVESVSQAFGQAILGTPLNLGMNVLVIMCLLGSLFTLVKYRDGRWVLFPYLLTLGLFVVVAGFPMGAVRSFITGVWYNDPFRLSALIPIGLLFILPQGINVLENKITGSRYANLTKHYTWKIVFIGLVGISCLVLSQAPALSLYAPAMAKNYRVSENSSLVSKDEMNIINDLNERDDRSGTVLVNPYRGGNFAYAFFGQSVSQEVFGEPVDSDIDFLNKKIDSIDENPTVCDVINKKGIRYVLKTPGPDIATKGSNLDGYKGIERMQTNDHLKVLKKRGKVYLYEIVGC